MVNQSFQLTVLANITFIAVKDAAKTNYQARKAETQTDAQKVPVKATEKKAKSTLARNPKHRTFVGMCLRHGENGFLREN